MANQSGASGTPTRGDAFSVLGRFVVRAPWLMIAAWIAVVGVLAVAFPPLTKVVESQTVRPLPSKDMAAAEQMAKDFGESAQNVLIVVLTDNRGLQPGDEDAYGKLAATLRGDSNDVSGVQDVRTTPALRPMMVSADNKAFYMAVNLRAPPGSPESSHAYQRITEIAKRSTAGSPLTAGVTGQAAMVGDLSIVSARDMHRIEIATALLVLIILLVIYRRLVTVLLPLITIGVSVASAQGVVSALTQLGLAVSALTIALMTAMIVGAGTDYAVFLISRYHEYIRSGIDSDLAVQRALSSIGKVIAASAATVVITFCGMVFTRLPALTSVGPALAVSIGIAFLAAVTLLPAILALAGRRGWVTPRRALTGRLWQRSAIQIVRRPKAHLLISLSMLIALAACAAFLRPTFNDRLQLPESAQSNVGFSTMENHFSTSTLLPQYIYVRAPQDLRTPRVLADLDQMAQRVSQLPNIAAVRGITRPTGQPLDQTKLSFQAGEVGTNLENASTRISDRTTDLDALTSGADQLAASLAEVRDQIRSASGPITQLTATLNQVQQQLATAAQLLDSIRGLANINGSVLTLAASVVDSAGAMIDALNNSRQCSADPACSAGRSNLEGLVQARNNGTLDAAQRAAAQNVQSTVQHLSALLATAGGSLRAPGINSLAGVPQRIAQMQDGADALADGSQRLDQGVRALVDQTKQLGLGMNQAADLLLSMKRDASQTSMAGMYIPPKVLTSDDFNNAAKMFISPDGHSVRYVVETKFDPFSPAAMDQVKSILNTVRGAQPNTSLSHAEISVVGPTAMYSAIRSYYDDDVRLIVMMTLLVVFAILVLLLRAIVAPLYLIASVVISFLSAVGTGVVFFQFVLHQAIYWNVQAMAFIVLVAVGADYNLLLITRIREESGSGIRSGIIRAVRSTGGVITSAGIIFAASMFGLLFGSLSTMVQTGFIIGVGLLIDTFVVRTITVPALAALIGRANWWPSKPTAATAASSDVPIAAETSAADIDFSDVRKACSTSSLVGEAHTTRVFSGSPYRGRPPHEVLRVLVGGGLCSSSPWPRSAFDTTPVVGIGMTATTNSTSVNPAAHHGRSAPHIAGTAVASTAHRYNQDEVSRELTEFAEPGFMRFAQTTGVDHRSLALPLPRYPKLTGFTEANDAYLEVAVDLGEQAITKALAAANIEPHGVDTIVLVSSTGIAVPTIDARLMSRIGFRPDIKRLPLFGLGCVGGAAGMARVYDYLHGYRDHVALLLAVELCSLTLQRDDFSIPALIGVSLFGDGAAAVVATGADCNMLGFNENRGPRVLATRSRVIPETVDVMGWNVGSSGFQLVMSRDVPKMADDYLRCEVDRFLFEHGLSIADISTWVCHPGGPKVLDSIENAIGLPPEALAHSRNSMRDNGNMSSASVLDVLRRTVAEPPSDGALAVMLAMGPGFSFELLLLQW